ncbi:MAG: hypothetical protein DVB23_001444 [Verrucomicrobia bacterium]|nr:MAG: hypothetical protein DVB23_001444 [Verrucomicrobiota bacterium]
MKTPFLPFVSACLITTCPCVSIAEDAAFRIRFGMKDLEPSPWDGSVELQGEGTKLRSVEGWRFEQQDRMTGPASWKASSRELTQRKSRSNSNLKNLKPGDQRKVRVPMSDNGILLRATGIGPETVFAFKTAGGDFSFLRKQLSLGHPLPLLDGRVEVERVADTENVTAERRDDDFPALAVAGDGRWELAWISFTPGLDRDERARTWKEAPENLDFLAKPAGGDQVWWRTRSKDGTWGAPVPVTDPGKDLFQCGIAVDGGGATWVIWSEREAGSFQIKAKRFANGAPGEVVTLSSGTGNQHAPVAVTAHDGKVWIAWQGAAPDGKFFHIFARHQTGTGWSETIDVSGPASGNAWSPALAAGKTGVAVAWDTYDHGDYDVRLRTFALDGAMQAVQDVASSPAYEARPSLAYDAAGRLWAAFEQGGTSWGKDWGAYDPNDGIGLYKERQVALRVLDGDAWKLPVADIANALRKPSTPRAPRNNAAAKAQPSAAESGRVAGEEAKSGALSTLNNLARITADASGRIWLLSRSREGSFHTPLGGVWMSYASCLNGNQWTSPVLVPHSDNLLYNRPSVCATPAGIAIAHSSDHRQSRLGDWVKSRANGKNAGNNASLDASKDPFDNDIYVSVLQGEGSVVAPELQAAAAPAAKQPSPAALAERKAIETIRAYRSTVQGNDLRILRGEFHRHTENSGDGMGDGALEDMWRYGIDVAGMDWIGNGDHDNGGGREYPWWLTQKTTDVFHLPGRFDPLFTYERSVPYPEGHRNVVFAQRGVRTLPRIPISDRNVEAPAPDTQMLYRYLHHFDGICAVHTSATSMGTDWRDNDPVVEPFVEIYQGARQNYERPGAPRCPTEGDSIGGWEPKGFVNLALQKGYKMSFQASSDHGSTHISYCLVYAKEASRQEILSAMKLRHTYGATDNIVADLRCGEHMMGDAFSLAEAPKLDLKLIGTAPFSKVTLVQDDQEVQVWTPGTDKVEISWTGIKLPKGKTSYYYFRGEQTDSELVWVSPVWITGE